jgi:hypothetical protein
MMFKLIISLMSFIILKLGLRSLTGFMTSHVDVGLKKMLSLYTYMHLFLKCLSLENIALLT